MPSGPASLTLKSVLDANRWSWLHPRRVVADVDRNLCLSVPRSGREGDRGSRRSWSGSEEGGLQGPGLGRSGEEPQGEEVRGGRPRGTPRGRTPRRRRCPRRPPSTGDPPLGHFLGLRGIDVISLSLAARRPSFAAVDPRSGVLLIDRGPPGNVPQIKNHDLIDVTPKNGTICQNIHTE